MDAQFFENIVENVNMSIIILHGKTGRIIYANKRALKLYEYTLYEITQLTTYDIVAISKNETQRLMYKVVAGEINYFESIHRTKYGHEFPVAVYSNLQMYKGELHVLAVILDISSRNKNNAKNVQQQVIKNNLTIQEAESIGFFSGGLAHDFRNILQSILGNSELLEMSDNLTEKEQTLIANIQKGVQRSMDLTSRLLNFTKKDEPMLELVKLSEFIKEAIAFIRAGSPTVKFNLQLNAPIDLTIDTKQILRSINNIVMNGIQAMQDYPQCEKCIYDISTSLVERANIKYAQISFVDYGKGIPQELQSKIFTPYFTTKKTGSGIGLATTASIVHSHDGIIEFDSRPGRTEFHILLPLNKRAIDTVHMQNEKIILFEYRGINILLLDDDIQLHSILSKYMSRFGVSVYSAFNVAECISELRKHKENNPINVALVDLAIEGDIDGEDAIKYLQLIQPKIPIIVFSGYGNRPIMQHPQDFGIAAVITKPASLHEITSVITSVLNQHNNTLKE